MIAEAIEIIQYLTTRGLMPVSEKIDGRTYVRAADGGTVLVKPPLPAPLQVMTLQGVVDYGEGDGSELACLVESPSKGRLTYSLRAALPAGACQTKDVNERVSEDDGAAQSVTVKDGIVGSKELVTANPYRLSPRRTFAEA